MNPSFLFGQLKTKIDRIDVLLIYHYSFFSSIFGRSCYNSKNSEDKVVFMQEILKYLRQAIDDFHMLVPGDLVCVGVSGGKDSLVLLYALHLYRKYFFPDFSLYAITVDLGFPGADYEPVSDFCHSLAIPYEVLSTNIASIVFDQKKEENPCSLCAKLRKGAFYEAAGRLSCNKAAFGHHKEDVVETFLMNLLYNAKLDVFLPVTFFPDQKITLLRPLVYTSEACIRSASMHHQLPVITSPCPADGHTSRQDMKHLISLLGKQYPRVKDRIFTAVKNTQNYHLWDKIEKC